MGEKKILVDGLRLSYNGPFSVVEFYAFVEDWMRKNGLNKEIKRKLEHVEPGGKKIEWTIEAWKFVERHAKSTTRVRALFNNVTEVELEKQGFKKKMNHGDVLIIIDGFLESYFHHTWWAYKPLWYFTRAIYDKYIWKFWSEKFDEGVRKISFNLHRELAKFFNKYKY